MISQAGRTFGHKAGAVVVLVILSACSAQDTRAPTAAGHQVSTKELTVGERAAVAAVRQIGVPYRYGGSTPDGFDCSGLVHYAYARAGKRIPRTTRGQWRDFHPVNSADLRVGDILFFDIGGAISHVGLYVGSRRFVHAPSSGREVTIEELDSGYYRETFVRAGRP